MKSRLHIALVLNKYDPGLGGLESWTAGMARWLLERGHKVSVISAGGEVTDPGINFIHVPTSNSPLALAASIAQKLSIISHDIVHDTGTGYLADVFQPQTGSRLVNAEHDIAALAPIARLRAHLSPRSYLYRRQMATLERQQFSDPSRLIAVSRLVRDQIASRFNLDASRIAVVHNGVDTDRFSPDKIQALRPAARDKWDLHGDPVFLLIANNFHLKGVATAIRAMARIRSTLPGARLAIAGNGDPVKYICMAEKLGVADMIVFLGGVVRIEEALAAADVAIQPSYYDACSLATLEGLACALPTITTIMNGAGELITNGIEGFILPLAGDHDALAMAMSALGDPTLRKHMGMAARKLALSNDLNVNYSRIEAFYRERLAFKSAGGNLLEHATFNGN